jgi:hypothetical protein
MSKINGDKARQNRHDRKRAQMRARVRLLLKGAPKPTPAKKPV